MAGGMRRRSTGSLASRVAATTGGPEPPSVKHCWVTGADGRLPGLLLAWRQGVEGWQGRVVHPVRETSGWVLVEEWLPATALTPVPVAERG